jgi:hypothetical protein
MKRKRGKRKAKKDDERASCLFEGRLRSFAAAGGIRPGIHAGFKGDINIST